MADTYITCPQTTCTVVISSSTDLANIDLAGGSAIAGAILAVWALGAAFRWFIKTLSIDSDVSPTNES